MNEAWELDTASEAGSESVTFPNTSIAHGFKTIYSYDPLNNLTTVNQGVQMRSFTYSSLSRLLTATNPESGTIRYSYDPNGNLLTKTDARGVKTDYVYDALNRVTNRNYSLVGPTPPNYQATPNVSYFYDNLPNARGKLIKVASSVSTTEYTAFDILGRVTAHKQTTDGQSYTTGYLYNLSGALIEETYPSGRVVKNVLDSSGDLSIVQSGKCLDANPATNATCTNRAGLWNYASSFTYNAAGAVTSMQLGNGLWESTVFNTRLQPTRIALGTTQVATNLLKLDYEYGATAAVNGNVTKQTITVPTLGQHNGFTAVQTYNYDSLNRLKSATENIDGNPTPSWKQTFTFDRYGNRRFDEPNTTTLPKNCGTPPNQTVCPADVPIVNPTISTANNRLTSTGWQYDAAGNTTADPEGRTFIYDGENKQVEVRNATNAIIGQYRYDGDGRRVKKIVQSTGETTVFVYDASNKLVAEYSTQVEPASTAKISYLTNDHLGSPRITTDALGQVVSRRDFRPFGEEVARANYGSDSVRQKFTSYERDIESNLDFAQARYYGYNHGRFTSPDPLAASANPIRPQSWNRYSYSYNNPLRFTDPSGMIAGDFYNLDGKKIGTDGIDDGKIYIVYDKEKAKEIEKTKGNYTGTVDAKITIASADVITAIGEAVTRSNNATYDTSPFSALGKDEKASGGFRETGVTWTTTDGKTVVTAAPDGDYSDPRVNKTAEISLPSGVDGKAHVHPSGEIVKTESSGNQSGGGVVVFGGTTKTSTANFVQKPSATDISNALPNGTNIVVGARDKTVYFYKPTGNDSGCNCVAKMSLNNFLKIGRQR